jgi:hypothetical protein
LKPRPQRNILLWLGLFIVLESILSFYQLTRAGVTTEPVVVRILGLPPEQARRISVYRLSPALDEDFLSQDGDQPVWKLPIDQVWGLRIRLP